MKENKNLLKTLLVYVLILLISISLIFLLNYSSFEETYTDSITSKYKQINRSLATRIEAALNIGKPLYNFSGMDNYLADVMQEESDIINLFVSQTDSKILYSHLEDYESKYLHGSFLEEVDTALQEDNYFLYNEEYYIVSPLYYEEDTLEGYLFLKFGRKTITDGLSLVVNESSKIFIYTLIIAFSLMALIFVMMNYFVKFDANKTKKHFIIYMIVILVVSQVACTLINASFSEKTYVSISNENLNEFSEQLSNEIHYFLDLGVSLDRMNNFDGYMLNELMEIEEAKEIVVIKEDNQLLYYADKSGETTSVFDEDYVKSDFSIVKPDYTIKDPIMVEEDKAGYLLVILDDVIINQKRRELLLDSLTVLMISLLISYHIMLFFSMKKVDKPKHAMDYEKNRGIIIQVLSFIYFFARMIPLSFVPIYIRNIFNNNPIEIFGLSEEVIIGLPITSYMFGAAVFAFTVGLLSRRISLKRIMVACAMLMIVGFVGSALSNNILSLIIARMITGFGEGGILISVVSLIIGNYKSGNTAQGFGYWASGYGAASICAIPIGGVIGYRFGFEYALLVGALFSLAVLFYSAYLIKNPDKPKEVAEVTSKKTIKDFNIFSDRNVFSNFFFRIIPFHLVYVGLFQFIMPLMMDDIGMPASGIGRTMTIFGIAFLFMPLASKIVDKYKSEKLFLALGSIIIGISLLLFNLSVDPMAFIIIITGIAIGSMLADSGEEVFVTSTKKAKEIGEARFMSIYTTFEGIVMFLVPIIMGIIVVSFGTINSIMIIAIFSIVSAVIHLFVTKSNRKNEDKQDNL